MALGTLGAVSTACGVEGVVPARDLDIALGMAAPARATEPCFRSLF
ncbi:MAG TPA: hypothetical protein VH590_01065 [Ktedonobacterales bacterium]